MAREEYLEQDLIYAAATMDCEGSISLVSYQGKRCVSPSIRLTIHVSNTNPILVEWLSDTFGGYHSIRYPGGRNRPIYRWIMNGDVAAWFLNIIMPYLKLKVEQAIIAIEFQSRLGVGATKRLSQSEVEDRLAMKEAMNILNKRGI